MGHQGQRVVEGQRVIQAASDIFLGWTEDVASRRYFYVRHLKNRRLGSIGELVEQNRTPEDVGNLTFIDRRRWHLEANHGLQSVRVPRRPAYLGNARADRNNVCSKIGGVASRGSNKNTQPLVRYRDRHTAE
jgi:hypothetical protein